MMPAQLFSGVAIFPSSLSLQSFQNVFALPSRETKDVCMLHKEARCPEYM